MRLVTAYISSIEQEIMVKTNEPFLDVTVTLIYQYDEAGNKLEQPETKLIKSTTAEGKEVDVPETRKFSFAIDTAKQHIIDEIKKFVDLYNKEEQERLASQEQQAKLAEANKHVQELTEELVGGAIS